MRAQIRFMLMIMIDQQYFDIKFVILNSRLNIPAKMQDFSLNISQNWKSDSLCKSKLKTA